MDGLESRSYYVVVYDWRDDDGNTYVTERVFDIYDDAKAYAESWPSGSEPLIVKRFYGDPYTVIRKAEFTKDDICDKDRQIKAFEVAQRIDKITFDHLNNIIKTQKSFYEKTIAKLTKYFNEELQNAFISKSS